MTMNFCAMVLLGLQIAPPPCLDCDSLLEISSVELALGSVEL